MLKNKKRANITLGRLITGSIENIGLIYIFILPVYFPIRALGLELNSYNRVLHGSSQLIMFFSKITIVIAFTSILLSFLMEFFTKRFFTGKESLIIHWYRSIASILSIVFIFSSFFVLNPENQFQLYFWSGVHYFVISYFQILIRAELSTYKNHPKISITQANNYFGFSLNLVGILSIFIFGWFYDNKELNIYSEYCVVLEVIFVIYLILVRGYWRDCFKFTSSTKGSEISFYILLTLLALFFSGCISIILMSIGVIAPVVTLGLIYAFYREYKKSIKISDLKLLINISLGYGLILSILTGSVLTYFIDNLQNSAGIFNFAYSTEPLFSLVLGLIVAWSLVKYGTEYSRKKIYQQISYINYLVPMFFILFYMALITEKNTGLILITMFGIYAYIEYMSMFLMRQIAQFPEYNSLQGTRLTCFNTMWLNGLCPSLIYISVYAFTHLTYLSLNVTLIDTIAALLILSLGYNVALRYQAKQ